MDLRLTRRSCSSWHSYTSSGDGAVAPPWVTVTQTALSTPLSVGIMHSEVGDVHERYLHDGPIPDATSATLPIAGSAALLASISGRFSSIWRARVPWSIRPTSRSIRCNGEQLKYFRNRRQLTQEELTEAAGLSVRVLAKAEAGGTLHADTIELLAEALSDQRSMVFPEDLICDPRALTLQFIRSYAFQERQLVANCQGILADDVNAIMAGDPTEIPFSGRFEGIDAVDQLWGAFFKTVRRPDKMLATRPQFLAVEGNQVLSVWREIADLPGTPSIGPQTLFTLFQFERGKIVHFETHFDTLLAARQLQALRSQDPQ